MHYRATIMLLSLSLTMGNAAGEFFFVGGTRMDIPCFFAGSIMAKQITIASAGLFIEGFAATGVPAMMVGAGVFMVGAGVFVGIVGFTYLLVKYYEGKQEEKHV